MTPIDNNLISFGLMWDTLVVCLSFMGRAVEALMLL